MTSKPETQVLAKTVQSTETEIDPSQGNKEAFVEPEISSPVSVLETTTFFQFTDSGVTNP